MEGPWEVQKNLRYFYPGDACTISDGDKIFSGLCAMGSCHSMEYTCAVDITRDFSGASGCEGTDHHLHHDCHTEEVEQ